MLPFILIEENKSTVPHYQDFNVFEQCKFVQSWYPRVICWTEKKAIKDDIETSCLKKHYIFKCEQLDIALKVVFFFRLREACYFIFSFFFPVPYEFL